MSSDDVFRSSWTVDTLFAHLTALMEEKDRRQNEALHAHELMDGQRQDAVDEALAKASGALEKRLDGMNQFRDQLREQTSTFLGRGEYEVAHMALRAEVTTNLNALRDQVNRNTDDISTAKGKGLGLNAGWGYLMGMLGVIASVVAVAIALSH